MAMMMTGRVLLVCALCVLWCIVAAVNGGAVAAMESEEESERLPSGRQDGDGRGHQESEDSVQQESETANESLGAGKGKSPKKQDGVVSTQPINSDRTVIETETERGKSKEEGSKETTGRIVTPKRDEKITELTSTTEEDRKKASPPAERAQTKDEITPGVTPPAKNENSAGILSATPGKAMVIPEGNSKQSEGGTNPANGLATAMPSTKKGEAPEALTSQPTKNEKAEGDSTVRRNTEKPIPEVTASVQKTEILLDDEEVTSNQRNEDLASTTGNQEGEQSDFHAESTPKSISAASNAANDDADTDTDQGIPNNDSATGGAVTEGRHQDGKKEERAEEKTPLKSVPIINDTATTGDSDGSTAVSHTTSPLLLLLVVACAAAAAVVAA
ncbi:Mucin-associated surface protein (MASP) [Trypanosoma cruzi]|uniref:Mucin-associated surface protein (MASP), putative n=2 Tax=Trypanosoma cruzi TaxID=5693 RepID=Q4E4X8_TRYCC|nr:mucin-associated surface protein (MASP), putative [Trypanosoma cruzi]EAN99833.1 mucin-associated surface protein (MASP), putative [Trypanosoma cruzi]PWV21329.1 Mucin-associated surface protein (MASP) [Trypanosoma cruzi]RNC42819.1 mucin-associated surface protein (MASP) [Trypanosoma cruzi]|eukprot:XP_821684.1 mucin-associated surface protein (MASP) [Trypanosoma cruzi strain CL Brener]